MSEYKAKIKKIKSVFEYQVTFSDCDPANMVYYPRILEWMDWSTEKLFRSVGWPWHEHFGVDGMGGLPLLDIQVSFTHPCRFGDQIGITTWIDAFEGRKFTVRHEMVNSGILAAECREYRAWVIQEAGSPKGLRAVPVPQEVQELFHIKRA